MSTNDHTAGEPASGEAEQFGPTEDATVVLDIGGDVGALILQTDASLHRAEIEISPMDDNARDVFQWEHPHVHVDADGHSHSHSHSHDDGGPLRTHVAVRERKGPDGSSYAAIYPGLREGSYQLWHVDGRPADIVTVVGGEVAEVDWR